MKTFQNTYDDRRQNQNDQYHDRHPFRFTGKMQNAFRFEKEIEIEASVNT